MYYMYTIYSRLYTIYYILCMYVYIYIYILYAIYYIPCHAMLPCHTIPYHTIPYHTIPYHTILPSYCDPNLGAPIRVAAARSVFDSSCSDCSSRPWGFEFLYAHISWETIYGLLWFWCVAWLYVFGHVNLRPSNWMCANLSHGNWPCWEAGCWALSNFLLTDIALETAAQEKCRHLSEKHSFSASLSGAIQQQKLLSSPWFGVFRAKSPRGLLLRRSVFFTDTGSKQDESPRIVAYGRGPYSLSGHAGRVLLNKQHTIIIISHMYICISLSLSIYIYIYIHIYIYTYPYRLWFVRIALPKDPLRTLGPTPEASASKLSAGSPKGGLLDTSLCSRFVRNFRASLAKGIMCLWLRLRKFDRKSRIGIDP